MIDFTNLHLYHENNRIEAKQAQGGLPHSIWETYSAFANTMGGIILLGVMETEDKSFRSVPLGSPEWLADEFWQRLNDGSHVNINVLTRNDVRIEESDGNPVVVIEVPKADRRHRPVYIGNNPYTGSYRRNGEGDYRCTPEEVRSMLRDRSDPAQDTQLLTDITLADLNTASVIRYHAAFSALHQSHSLAKLDFPEFLCQLGAAGKSPDGAVHPTNGGLLMFGQYQDICRHFPGFTLRYCEEITDIPSSDTECCSPSDFAARGSFNLYEFYTHIREKLSKTLPVVSDSTAVQQALCEAIANALVHADYQNPQGVGLSITKTNTELRISNPGSFRINVKEAMRGRISDPRNASLSTMFGMILPRPEGRRGLSAVLNTWEKQSWPTPRIREEFNPDRTTLILPLRSTDAVPGDVPVKTALGQITFSQSVREQQIAEILTKRPVCTLDELCHALNLSKSWVRKLLRKMREKNLISSDNNRPDKKKQYRLTI